MSSSELATEQTNRMEYLVYFGVPLVTLLGSIVGGWLWGNGYISKQAAQTTSVVLFSTGVACCCFVIYSLGQDLRERRRGTS